MKDIQWAIELNEYMIKVAEHSFRAVSGVV